MIARCGWPRLAAAALALGLLVFPLIGSRFLVVQIGAQSLVLGIVALSLIFLAGYGGMVSLVQTTLYGLAGYTIGLLTVVQPIPWFLAVLAAVAVSALVACGFALIAVRTQGIYFLMITLALGMVVFAFANQNYTIFHGHRGINGIRPPTVAGAPLSDPIIFYYVCLVAAAMVYGGLRYLARAPFGLALQAIRDNPRRMRALGYWVPAHRVAAFALAGAIAGLAGVLGVWYNGAISPATIDLTRIINVLVIAVVGGIAFPEGAFLGALVFTLVHNFASSYTDRYNTVIGLTFLVIVLFSPNGLIGLARSALRLRARTKHAAVPADGRLAGAGTTLGSGVASDPADEAVEAE